MTEVLERRATPKPVTFRAAPEGGKGPGMLNGYAAVFDSLSRDLGGWCEEIDPEAFGPAGDLDMDIHHRVLARAEHESEMLLGTTNAGTLRLYVDDVGLSYEVDLPDTNAGRDVAVLAERGDYAFSSFAFYTLPDGRQWREDENGILVSRVTAARLVDVAPVADPAYWASSAQLARSFDLEQVRESLRPQPTPPGDFEHAAADSLRSMKTRFETRSAHPDGHRTRRGGRREVR